MGEPNWVPLERIVELAGAAGQVVSADEFMAMAEVQLPDRVTVYLYKHIDTRRYLNVDTAGHTYRYRPLDGVYQPWLSQAPAIAHAVGRGVAYQCWTNVDAGFGRCYRPGDGLVAGWSGELDGTPGDIPVNELAEEVFARHNRDDRPDAQLSPSMSIGDVVVFGETALSVDAIGFKPVQLDTADLITDRVWRDVVADPTPPTSAAHSILQHWTTAQLPVTAGVQLGIEG